MKYETTTKIKASADKVWTVFAHQFDEAEQWISSVTRSYGTDRGEQFESATTTGRVCEFKSDGRGMKVFERFVVYDEAMKRASVRVDFIDPPWMLPMQSLSLDFHVSDDAGGGSTAVWRFGAAMKPLAKVITPVLKLSMKKAWSELAEELAYYVETGSPHPRKLAAIDKAKAQRAASDV